MKSRQSIAQARENLASLIKEAESGKPVELTRRGEPVAVLIGSADYERLTGRSPAFFDAWQNFSRDAGLAGLAIDPDAIFARTRDPEPGRESPL